MTALQITDIRQFMNKLFLKESFDAFWLSEATFITFNTFHIDGTLHQDYYTAQERAEDPSLLLPCSTWRQIRPFCLELIKGTHTPLEFKIVFRLSCANVERLLSQSGLELTERDVNGLFLNLHYKSGSLMCTTGTSLAFFTLDKSLDQVWDNMVKKYFHQQNISYEPL